MLQIWPSKLQASLFHNHDLLLLLSTDLLILSSTFKEGLIFHLIRVESNLQKLCYRYLDFKIFKHAS